MARASSFVGPGPVPPLGVAEVHVWFASLAAGSDPAAAYSETLTSDEAERASRFRFERDRRRFVVGRGLLRKLLGAYTDSPPGALRFAYGAYGKPELVGGGLAFNVSHSHDAAVFAVARSGEVGVDIEAFDPRPRDREVAERFFSPAEVRSLLALSPEEQPRAFLACWTRKEAFIKARGDGLSLSLQDFDVTFAPGDEPAVLRTAWSATEPTEWQLCDLSVGCDGYLAALAVHSAAASVTICSSGTSFLGDPPPAFSGAYPMG